MIEENHKNIKVNIASVDKTKNNLIQISMYKRCKSSHIDRDKSKLNYLFASNMSIVK